MNKTAVKGMSAVLVLVVLGIAAGMITRRTFVDNTDLKAFVDTNPHVEYCDINYAEDDSLGLVDGDSVESVSDLMAEGELVVKVHLDETWNRELYQECVLSKVKVDNVYQGSGDCKARYEAEYGKESVDGGVMMWEKNSNYPIFYSMDIINQSFFEEVNHSINENVEYEKSFRYSLREQVHDEYLK